MYCRRKQCCKERDGSVRLAIRRREDGCEGESNSEREFSLCLRPQPLDSLFLSIDCFDHLDSTRRAPTCTTARVTYSSNLASKSRPSSPASCPCTDPSLSTRRKLFSSSYHSPLYPLRHSLPPALSRRRRRAILRSPAIPRTSLSSSTMAAAVASLPPTKPPLVHHKSSYEGELPSCWGHRGVSLHHRRREPN